MHNLAYELRMTVGQMCASMTMREFSDWVEWYRMRAAAQARAASPAPAGSLDLTSDSGVAALATMFKK